MIRSFHVFEGIRVHGITCSSVICNEGSLSVKLAYKLAVFGEKRVKLFSLNVEVALTSEAQSEVLVDLNFVHSLPRFNNWVLDVCFLKVKVCYFSFDYNASPNLEKIMLTVLSFVIFFSHC